MKLDSIQIKPLVDKGSMSRPYLILTGLALGLGLLIALILFRSPDDSLANLRARGVIRIGYAIEAPYAYLADDGNVTGLDPEVARMVANRLGIPRIEWRLMEFDALLAGLKSGQYDVTAAGLFITPERARQVIFSQPTFQARPGLLVNPAIP